MFLYDTEHTGLSPFSAACSTSSGSPKWSYSAAGSSSFSSPAIDANGVSYFADYYLYAMNPTGGLKWTFSSFGGDTYSSPAIGTDGTIYVGSLDGKLYAITPGGIEKWAFLTTLDDAVESSPAIGTDGTIYVGSDDNNLYAINPDGSLKWAFTTGGWVRSSPAIGPDGTIYVASDDGSLYALTDGGQGTVTKKWAPFSAGAYLYSSPTVGKSGGTIYFSSNGNNVVYAINASTGLENWEFPYPDDYASTSSPAIGTDGTIYIGSYDGNVYALTDGGGSATEKWAFTTGGAVNSSPAIGADGTIYIGSDDGYVYAITDNGPYCPSCSPPVTGTPPSEKWPPIAIGTPVDSSPAIGANASIYFGAGSNLYAQPPGPSVWPATSISALGSLALGNSPVGDITTKSLTLKNTGTKPMYLLGASSTDASEFAEVSSTCPSSGTGVGHNGTCTITIGFTPNTLGARPMPPASATLTLLDNGTVCPQAVNVSGTGTADMTVAPASYSIGEVKVGMKLSKGVTVTNKQKTTSVSLSESFGGPNASDFTVTGGTCTTLTPPSTLGAGKSCTLVVTYAPTAVGIEGATMTVTDSPDLASPLGYKVSFNTAATIPESLSVTNLHFGNVAQTASKAMNITVTNKAKSGPITVSTGTITGSNSGDFQVTGGSCTTLAGGSLGASSSCIYAVTFTPSTENPNESAALPILVAEDPNGGPAAVGMFGNGVTPLKVTPATISFGTVTENTTTRPRTVTVINLGAAALTISESVALTSLTGNSDDFAVTGGTCTTLVGGSLAGGNSCTYGVTFKPSTVGSLESATLAVSAPGDAASHSVILSGTGD